MVQHIKALLIKFRQHADLAVVSRIDEMFYLEKIEELRLLEEQYERACSQAIELMDRISNTCALVSQQMARDNEWFDTYMNGRKSIL